MANNAISSKTSLPPPRAGITKSFRGRLTGAQSLWERMRVRRMWHAGCNSKAAASGHKKFRKAAAFLPIGISILRTHWGAWCGELGDTRNIYATAEPLAPSAQCSTDSLLETVYRISRARRRDLQGICKGQTNCGTGGQPVFLQFFNRSSVPIGLPLEWGPGDGAACDAHLPVTAQGPAGSPISKQPPARRNAPALPWEN